MLILLLTIQTVSRLPYGVTVGPNESMADTLWKSHLSLKNALEGEMSNLSGPLLSSRPIGLPRDRRVGGVAWGGAGAEIDR